MPERYEAASRSAQSGYQSGTLAATAAPASRPAAGSPPVPGSSSACPTPAFGADSTASAAASDSAERRASWSARLSGATGFGDEAAGAADGFDTGSSLVDVGSAVCEAYRAICFTGSAPSSFSADDTPAVSGVTMPSSTSNSRRACSAMFFSTVSSARI